MIDRYCGGGYYCCPCSFLRIFLTLIGTIILVTAITAVIMSILMNQKATTSKTIYINHLHLFD